LVQKYTLPAPMTAPAESGTRSRNRQFPFPVMLSAAATSTPITSVMSAAQRNVVRMSSWNCARLITKKMAKGYPGIPSRGAAFSILLLQLAALVFAFAQVNLLLGLQEIDGVGDAVTDAFVTATTLNHGHYNLKGLSFLAHSAVALEVSSALLLLIVFFPLLVSRFSMFAGETAPAPPPRKPVFALTVEGTVSCTVKTPSGKVKKVPDKFTVTEDGEIVAAATG
jgi:hypothetical protein